MDRLCVFSSIVLFLGVLIGTRGASAAWLQAHATFYGGSDASGTMGELYIISFYPLCGFNYLTVFCL